MTLNEALKIYALNDGQISHFEFDFRTKKLNMKLLVRKHIAKQSFEPREVMLTFHDVKLFDIFEDFPTNGQYSDITIFENENDGVYASFDPYGNSGIAHEDDNWIIKAEQIIVNEL